MVVKKTLGTLGLVLLAFLLAISGYTAAKKPVNNQIDQALVELGNLINYEAWEQAGESVVKVKNTWDKAKPKYQLNHTTVQLNNFEESMNRLEFYIKGKDKTQGMAELAEVKLFWQRLNRL